MKLLAFDTSSKALSVAILEDETLLAETTLTIKKNHSITLMPVIDFLMQQIDLKPKELDRIVVAERSWELYWTAHCSRNRKDIGSYFRGLNWSGSQAS